MSRSLRIAFMGTPDFSVPALNNLIASRHKVVCVYSQPPRPKGRGQQVQESPVHKAALDAGIEVRTPLNFKKDEDIAAFMALELDVAVVAAYGLILPKPILDAPAHGCINIHASLLPRWRGAAPIHRAILAGDEESGITIMQMEEGLDTGPMISMKAVPIRPSTTAQGLHDMLSALGSRMIVDVMNDLADNGTLPMTVQPDEGFTYAKMLKKEEGRIDWTQEASAIDRQIRALNPWPGTWCDDAKGRRLKILDAVVMPFKSDEPAGTILDEDGVIVCGNRTTLKLETVQPESKSSMAVSSAYQGKYLIANTRLG
ncbi:MAG: methionyl-tRNA formyltransferase [Micavibrio aeruginosavorus]|uniref:Methionyl-tRNA formyltransferase n=1 Tax=Micavibrio aeruginosavorus TaxID=349221 RepID=A0A2W4ZD45_9BACT|nr:MAG: methionyl-tRNA formyltransferase [Micavibrio aeruginosavorus]